jgi:MFS family permease
MRPTFAVVRAIGIEFARRALKPIMIISIVGTLILLAIGGWLTTKSAWWWFLEAFFIIGSLILAGTLIAIRAIFTRIGPKITRAQRKDVQSFVDKLEYVAESIKTPYPVIIFYVVRDTLRPKPNGFIESVSRDSKTLAPDFIKLRKDFEQ